jgi:hypothetical protein
MCINELKGDIDDATCEKVSKGHNGSQIAGRIDSKKKKHVGLLDANGLPQVQMDLHWLWNSRDRKKECAS